MRKCLSIIWMALMGMTLLTACSGDDPEGIPSKERLDVKNASVAVLSTEAVAIVPVEANCRWKVTLDKGWEGLTVDTREGDGTGNIRILTGVNETVNPRSASITVESNSGVIKKKVTISQEGGDVILSLSETTLAVSDVASQDKVINVTCNTDWTVTSSDPTVVETDIEKGSQNGSVRLLVKENLTGKPRPATLTFAAGTSTTKTVKINQDKHVLRLTLGVPSISVGAAGDTRNIEVQSNTSWSVSSSDPTHFTPDLTRGNEDQTVKLTIAENMREDARTAVITFVVNDTLRQQIHVEQDGKVVSLQVSKTEVMAQAIGGDYSIPVTCNAEWSVVSDSYWASVPSGYVEGSGNISLNCLQNTQTQERTAQLTIIAGSKRAFVVVKQQPGMLPSLDNTGSSGIGRNSAVVSFNYQSSTSNISEYGVCYATHEHPTIADQTSRVSSGDLQTAANVQVTLTGLESGTTYYARPYVINATGISYGDEISFTTAGSEPGSDDVGLPAWSRRK